MPVTWYRWTDRDFMDGSTLTVYALDAPGPIQIAAMASKRDDETRWESCVTVGDECAWSKKGYRTLREAKQAALRSARRIVDGWARGLR